MTEKIKWNHKDLVSLEPLSKEELIYILETAKSFEEVLKRDVKKVPTLRGKSVLTLFYEPSTRTRTSFEMAAKILSADTINISTSASSVSKGETLLDTVKNLEAMSIDAIIIRHSFSGAAEFLSKRVKASVINGGDGRHEHPTQALLDILTIWEYKNILSGLKIAIVGDILHSRVARSNLIALKKLGNEVRFVGPATFIPETFRELGAEIYYNLEEGLYDADVVMALRIQKERMGSGFYPTEREYARCFSINKNSINFAKKDAIIMHPGPVNRGLEITSDVLDDKRCVVLDQVTKGVAVRMAVLYLLLTGGKVEN
ncbi:MAG: aspartate carbamoyltransferase catalytic subunit [Proteobacteria bacterium]|nr:aspartate carbamoyltransferase catalytic subunit [Pseudomonadota bacterium]